MYGCEARVYKIAVDLFNKIGPINSIELLDQIDIDKITEKVDCNVYFIGNK